MPHVKVVAPEVEAAARAIGEAIDGIDVLRRAARDAQGDVARFLSWERAARVHLETYAAISAEGSSPRGRAR